MVPLGDVERTADNAEPSTRLAIARALRSLPRGQCQALFLHDGLGQSVPEIARDLGLPEGTVKSWVSRGRAALLPLVRSDAPTTTGDR